MYFINIMDKVCINNNKSLYQKLLVSSNKSLNIGLITASTQISTLIWLRTIMIYQYEYNTTFNNTFKNLYKDGGLMRFYKGYIPSLIICNLCRFNDLNAYYLMQQYDYSIYTKTTYISLMSCMTRLLVTPIDNLDIHYQLYGNNGFKILKNKIYNNNFAILYNGSFMWANIHCLSTFTWFLTHEYLNTFYLKFNIFNSNQKCNLFIENIYYCVNGFTCYVLCDIITNTLRVVKLKKQTSNKSYYNCIRQIYNNYNFNGFYRGFHTRLLYQGIQNSLFVLLWKNLEKLYL